MNSGTKWNQQLCRGLNKRMSKQLGKHAEKNPMKTENQLLKKRKHVVLPRNRNRLL